MLEKERFLAIKKLARDIRKDNDDLFKKFEKENPDEAIKEKEKFIADLIDNMESAFSDGEQGREEKQIFRANVLIPDDDEFYNSYSENKNIRNLMKKYAVNIEDIMSKITELNIYAKFINDVPKESVVQKEETPKEETNFVDEMINVETKEKEDLLEEIDVLSNTLTDLSLETEKPKKNSFINKNIKTEEPEDVEEITPDKTEEINSEEPIIEEKEKAQPIDEDIEDDILDESFDNINDVVSNFVNDYNSAKEELQSLKGKNIELNKELKEANDALAKEKEILSSKEKELTQSTSKLNGEIKNLKDENSKLKKENDKAKERIKLLEEKLMKSATILKRLYNGINNK